MIIVLSAAFGIWLQSAIHHQEIDEIHQRIIERICEKTDDRMLIDGDYQVVYKCEDPTLLEGL